MFHARDNLTKIYGKKALGVLNLLAKFANALCAGNCMKMKKPDDPSESNPVSIGLDVDAASTAIAEKLGIEDDAGETYTDSTFPSDNTASHIGAIAATSGTIWEKGKKKNFCVFLPVCVSSAYGGDPECDRIYYAKCTFNHTGRLVKVEGTNLSLDVMAYT